MVATTRARSADERRADIQARAARMGIDEAYISLLVDSFYTRIRDDETLGPIFNNAISDWDAHLPNMKRFWSSVALNTGSYSGRPVPVHQKLRGITPEHFDIWLGLLKLTLEETAPTKEVVPYFMVRATRIAHSLQAAMFNPPKEVL